MAGYWHLGYLLKETALANDQLFYELNLPISHCISAIYLNLRANRDVTGGGVKSIPDIINFATVRRNGDEEIFRANGNVLERMARIQTGKQLPGHRTNVSNAVEEMMLPIFFGRWGQDDNFYLDTTGLSSLKLCLDLNMPITTGEFATGTMKLEVLLHQYMKGRPGEHLGLVKTRELERFQTAASGTKIIDLPRGWPFYRIYVYNYKAGVNDFTSISALTLNLDNGLSVPFNMEWEEAKQYNKIALGLDGKECGVAKTADSDYIETYTGACRYIMMQLLHSVSAGDDTYYRRVKGIGGGRVQVSGYTVEGSATWAALVLDTTKRVTYWWAEGEGVGNIVAIPFDVWGDMSYLLPSRDYSKVELELTQGGAASDCVVMLQEILPR